MAAQTMRGTTGMVLSGEHPAILRDKVSTPGGCTIGGLLVLEEGRVRGAVARAVREVCWLFIHSPSVAFAFAFMETDSVQSALDLEYSCLQLHRPEGLNY